jgi:hypothetical protein
MLNVYKYYDKPSELELREYAPALFSYDDLDDYVEKLSDMFNNEDEPVPEKYQLIARVFENTKKYHTHVVTYGDECILSPLGFGKRPSYSVKLISEDGIIHGFYTHYTKETKFCEERSKVDHETQMDDILTLGLSKLAQAELND